MAYSSQDRDFLFFLLARRRGWAADAQLEAAARLWGGVPGRSLAELVAEHARLTPGQLDELRKDAAAEAMKTRSEPIEALLAELPAELRRRLTGSAATQYHTPKGDALATLPSDGPTHGSRGPRAAAAEPLPASDRFEIVQLHAQGGLGAVFLARDGEIDRTVALKQIRSQWADDEDSRARFLLEAKITGRLEHPGIVPIYALGADASGRPYYAMRLIRGESLLAVIDRFHKPREEGADGAEKLPELRRLLARFVEVCNALEYAHSRGIIHRDVKPANIMLGRYGETLVVDWGLAKVVGDEEDIVVDTYTKWKPVGLGSGADSGSATRMGTVVGTPAYMSPEQAAGRLNDLGPQSDVYSLGATLFHLLTGDVPHDASDDIGVLMAQIDRGSFRSPRERERWIPKQLSAICMKALDPLPERRYASAGAMGEDLQRWLSDEPVLAYEDSLAERAFRWMRNHRTLVISAVAAQGVAAAAIVAGSILWSRVQSERRQQQHALDQQRQSRAAELEVSAEAAQQTALAELRTGRFETAVGLLDRASQSLDDEPQFAALRDEIVARRERAARLADFRRWGESAEELNFFQHDAEAQAELFDALERIGALDRGDWWNNLPAEDLTADQLDDLRFDVYRKFVLLASVHSKRMMRAGLSAGGADEARELLAASELAQRFRRTQSLRFFAGGARLRLGQSLTPPPAAAELDPPVTAADAYMLGGLWVVASQNPVLAATYARGETNFVANAKRQLTVVEALAPADYWSHFLFGFIELLEAGDPAVVLPSVSHPHYAAARSALGHSIAIKPDYWLSYAERSGAIRQEIESRRRHPEDARNVSQAESESQMLQWMIRDTQRAVEVASTRSEVQWYVAFAHWIAGNREAAIDALLAALELGERYDVETIPRLIDPERQRALPETLQIADDLLAENPDHPRWRTLRAFARLQLGENDLAWEDVAAALAAVDPPPLAFAVRGRLLLERGEGAAAQGDFRRALAAAPHDLFARLGLAQAHERQKDFAAALEGYESALAGAETAFQRAACELGRCRTLLAAGRREESLAAAAAAIEHKPACELTSVLIAAREHGSPDFAAELEARLKRRSVAARLAELAGPPRELPLLNGDFEIGQGGRHWNNDDIAGMAWQNVGGCQSRGTLDPTVAHRGGRSLHVVYPREVRQGYGVSSQTLPADPRGRYRLSLWAKASDAAAGVVQVVLDDRRDKPIVSLPAGTYDWQELAGEFDLKDATAPTVEGYRNVTLRILAVAPGEAWIDDVRIERIDDAVEP
ncbi:MAG: protein kinase [Pirellulales bacterium]|nr:protein kinase [Pirellulales bacterium]